NAAVLAVDHGRAGRDRDVRDLCQAYGPATRRRNLHVANRVEVLAKIGSVADLNAVALAALDHRRDHVAAEHGLNDLVNIGDIQPINVGDLTFDVDVDE